MDEKRTERLESALDDIGWGLLFVGVAALALPTGTAQRAAIAAIGAGLLLLNAGRLALHVPIGWFSTLLGGACLSGGLLALAGAKVDLFAIFFLLAGVVTVVAATIRVIRAPSAA